MGKAILSQFNFNNYAGARSILVGSGVPAHALEEISTDTSNNIFLGERSRYNYVISVEKSDENLYMNRSMFAMCKGLTMLASTELLNKDLVNYHYVVNMHSAFANCYKLQNRPVSAKYVKSMYGTYYNCTNIIGTPKVNINVNNLIGTYYNCGNLTGAPQGNGEDVIAAIGTYYNCINITGNPIGNVYAESMMDMYYNCYLLEGRPSNCNNAIITINTYYNCPNIYGNFYWMYNGVKQASFINAKNMFYGRNFQNQLNIYVQNNSAILNCLINYSSTFGNIYGLGDIQWSRLYNNSTDVIGYYRNDLYNTNIYIGFVPIFLSDNLNINEYVQINNSVEQLYTNKHYLFTIQSKTLLNIVPNDECLPDGFQLKEIINASQNIRVYFKSEQSEQIYSASEWGGGCNSIVQVTNTCYIITINNHSIDEVYCGNNYIFNIRRCDDGSIYKWAITLKNKFNNFYCQDYISFFDTNYVKNCQNAFRDVTGYYNCYLGEYCYTAFCPPNAENIAYMYYNFKINGVAILWNSWYPSDFKVPELVLKNFYKTYVKDEYTAYLYESEFPGYGDYEYPYNLIPKCGSKVTNMQYAFANTNVNNVVMGDNVINAQGAYRNCKYIPEDAYFFPPKLRDGSWLYAGPNSQFEGNFNGQKLFIHSNIINLAGCFSEAPNLTNPQDLILTPEIQNIDYIFQGCQKLMYTFNSTITGKSKKYSYSDCRSLIYSEDTLDGCQCEGTYKYCTNLIHLKYNNNLGTLYSPYALFSGCHNLVDDIYIEYLSGSAGHMIDGCNSINSLFINHWLGGAALTFSGEWSTYHSTGANLVSLIVNSASRSSDNMVFENVYFNHLLNIYSSVNICIYPTDNNNFPSSNVFTNLIMVNALSNINARTEALGFTSSFSNLVVLNIKNGLWLNKNSSRFISTTLNLNNLFYASIKTIHSNYGPLMYCHNLVQINNLTSITNPCLISDNLLYLTNMSYLSIAGRNNKYGTGSGNNIGISLNALNLKDFSSQKYDLSIYDGSAFELRGYTLKWNYFYNQFMPTTWGSYCYHNLTLNNMKSLHINAHALSFEKYNKFATSTTPEFHYGYFNTPNINLTSLTNLGINTLCNTEFYSNFSYLSDESLQRELALFNSINNYNKRLEIIEFSTLFYTTTYNYINLFYPVITGCNDLYITAQNTNILRKLSGDSTSYYNHMVNNTTRLQPLEQIFSNNNFTCNNLYFDFTGYSVFLLNRINSIIYNSLSEAQQRQVYNETGLPSADFYQRRYDFYLYNLPCPENGLFANIFPSINQEIVFLNDNMISSSENNLFNLTNILCSNIQILSNLIFNFMQLNTSKSIMNTYGVFFNTENNLLELRPEQIYDPALYHSQGSSQYIKNVEPEVGSFRCFFLSYYLNTNSTDFLGANLIFDTETNILINGHLRYIMNTASHTYEIQHTPVDSSRKYYYIEKTNSLYNIKFIYIRR